MRLVELNISITTVFLNTQTLTEYKCSYCNKNYQHKFYEKLKELFLNTCKFFKYDNNQVILLLLKGVYPYEYMGDWEKFNKTSLLKKKIFTVI